MKLDYNTGIEVYSIENHNKGDILIEDSIKNIQKYLTYRNPEKYKDFLEKLDKIGIILFFTFVRNRKQRLEILRKMYYALRLYDDIIDGDTLRKISYNERLEISKGKKKGLYDLLINDVIEIAESIGKLDGINYSINEIVGSMNFDLNRIIDKNKYRKKEDLDKNFHRMDIDGTIYGTAIIFGLNPISTISKLDTLGEATRISYNIRDIEDDIIEGLVNISKEELIKLGISDLDLEEVKNGNIPINIREWINKEIFKVHELLKDYNSKFGLFNILKGKGIELESKSSYVRKIFNNLILRYVVLPKGYISEISEIISDNT